MAAEELELENISDSDMPDEFSDNPNESVASSNKIGSTVSSTNSSRFKSFKHHSTSGRFKEKSAKDDKLRKEKISMDQLDKYTSKLQTICKDARFFLMKSNSKENILLSKSQGVWSTLAKNESKLNKAFETTPNVILIFSVNQSGTFSGFARLASKSERKSHINWSLRWSHSVPQIGGVFKVDWISKKRLDFTEVHHLKNPWNFSMPVKVGRDGQEIKPYVGFKLCSLFKMDADTDISGILKKSKDAQGKCGSFAVTKPIIGAHRNRNIGPYPATRKLHRYHYGIDKDTYSYDNGSTEAERTRFKNVNRNYNSGPPCQQTGYYYRFPTPPPPPPQQPLILSKCYAGPGVPMLRVYCPRNYTHHPRHY